jgi:hypothetical protein
VPRFLRKIRRARWDKQTFCDTMPWLQANEFPADPLGDLATVRGKMSVYEVPSPESLKRIAAAIAAGGDAPSNVDYIVFDSEILAALPVQIEETLGECPAPDVNNLHRHITQVSAERLLAIARLILDKGITDRIGHKELIPIIQHGVKTQNWRVSPELKKRLDTP